MDSNSSAPPSAYASSDSTNPTNAVSGIYDQLTTQTQSRARGAAGAPASSSDYTDSLRNLLTGSRQPQQRQREVDASLRDKGNNDDYVRQMPRRWLPGDVYAPHDLSPSEMGKFRRARSRQRDLVDMLGLNPLDMYRVCSHSSPPPCGLPRLTRLQNFSFIAEFTTPHGRIKSAADTGLRPVNQRKVAKAIRRAIGLGLHPSVHHHPEILSRDPLRRPSQNQPSLRNY